ncbi:MAG: hypothetical protein HFG26_08245 [Provencibacterium sp.]|jgi:hypothetical protein|nr:hypothetical protein [Provencibacterium sp.]
MEGYRSREDLIQNLKDAGCDDAAIATLLKYLENGRDQEILRLLKKHRRVLLNGLHREQRRIDCLDYLVFMLQKQSSQS